MELAEWVLEEIDPGNVEAQFRLREEMLESILLSTDEIEARLNQVREMLTKLQQSKH